MPLTTGVCIHTCAYLMLCACVLQLLLGAVEVLTSCNIAGILRSLEHGQEKLLSGQEDIQRRQEEQHAVVMDKLEKLEDGQKGN